MRRHHGLVSLLFLTLLVCLALLSTQGVRAQDPTDPDPNDPNPDDPGADPSPSPSPSPDIPSPSPAPSPSPEPQPSALPSASPPAPSSSQKPATPHPGAGAKGTLATPAGPVPTQTYIIVGFKDDKGTQLGTSAYLVNQECTPLDTTSIPQGVQYAFGSTSKLEAALNLYQDRYCQVAVSSAVGYWPNTGVTANVGSIRFEGIAPDSQAPGTLSPSVFPAGIGLDATWVMDPSKGKLLVGLVAAVLGVGVAIGVYQVYQAAQYIAPIKIPKKKKGNGLNLKKVKREDAYFRKPGYEPVSVDADGADTPVGHGRDSSKTSSRELLMAGQNKFKQSPHQVDMQQKYRLSLAKSLNSQYDMSGTTGHSSPLAPVSNSTTSSGRTLNKNNISSGLEGPSAIMMQERLQKQQDNRFSTGGISVASSGATFPAPPMTPPSFSNSPSAPFGSSASSVPAAAVADASLGGNRMGSSGSYSSPFAPPPLPSASRPRVDDTPMLIVEDDVILPAASSSMARSMMTPTTRSHPSEAVNLIDFRDRSANSSPRPMVPPVAPGGYVPRTQYSNPPPPPTPNHTRPFSGSQFSQQQQQQQQPPASGARYGNNAYTPLPSRRQ